MYVSKERLLVITEYEHGNTLNKSIKILKENLWLSLKWEEQ